MKKVISIFLIMCCVVLALSGCSKYKRISLSSGETLGEELGQYIGKDTAVVNTANDKFPDQLPIYKISERNISDEEFKTMLKNLELDSSAIISQGDSTADILIRSVTDHSAGEFNLTDEELEKLAWDAFNKLPFIEGNYKYFGITETITTSSDSTGTYVSSVGVTFRRMLDDVRVIGEDRCVLSFDNAGLRSTYIRLYNYEKIGTMDLVPLESAFSKIKNPDAFKIYTEPSEPELGMLDTLHVEKINLLLVNQYSNGCTILQPIYSYIGTATDTDGRKEEFNSKVIAIPESYTYVEKSEQ